MQSFDNIDNLLIRFENIFKDEMGTVKDIKTHIQLDSNSQPKFQRARTVPMALQQKVEKELNHLKRVKFIKPVRYSQ